MLESKFNRFTALPELTIHRMTTGGGGLVVLEMEKERGKCEICPKCASPSTSVYDHRVIKVRDEPLRREQVLLKIRKRRYFCKPCKKPFTEPVPGIMPGMRTTQRYRRSILWACENFSDLTKVRKAYKCSSALVYRILFEQLELKLREYRYPWPSRIGIDEHFFSRSKGYKCFATVITDMNKKRLREVAIGKDQASLREALENIPGRENVKLVALDLSDTYKSFVKSFFPNAKCVADKFHVLRLLHPHINRRRKDVTGDRRTLPLRRLLLVNGKKLDYFRKRALWEWLEKYPELKEVYSWKERMHGFYRIKGYKRARIAFQHLTDDMAHSELPEIKRLRRTLMRWREEILLYFKTRLTNARTEGFNNVAKLVQKRAYGYKNFRNYRLRLLSACA